MQNTDRSVERLRLVGLLEGISFLTLMGIAMPLKYVAHWPYAVKYVGWVHGILFIWYVVSLGQATASRMWPLVRVFLLFVAAVVPFGTFIADKWLRTQVQAQAA
ncbi:MAG: DUF3817 domain-containing protein [Deltaproteobacteria bacterium]|nr:DUF3817 domain-containing protein [Deltaproteobacteria bacterium]